MNKSTCKDMKNKALFCVTDVALISFIINMNGEPLHAIQHYKSPLTFSIVLSVFWKCSNEVFSHS